MCDTSFIQLNIVKYVYDRHGLARQPYLDIALQQQPIVLINSLFEVCHSASLKSLHLTIWSQDSSIEERSHVAAGQYPDLAAAAEAIATIHELSLVKIKYALLDKWLPVETGAACADDTMVDFTLNLNSAGSETSSPENSLDEVNLFRCVYLLQTGFEGGLQV